MVKWLNLKRRFSDAIPDWVWPHLTGDEEPAPQDLDFFGVKQIHLLNRVEKVLAARLAQAEERVQSVESKLMSLFTLTSVFSAAVVAGIATSSGLGVVEETAPIFVWIVRLLVFYLAFQCWCLLRATLAGLKRRNYRQLSPTDIAPQDGEGDDVYRIRLLNLQANYMRSNEHVVNEKVSAMAVAHAALANVLVSTFILIGLVWLNSLRNLVPVHMWNWMRCLVNWLGRVFSTLYSSLQ